MRIGLARLCGAASVILGLIHLFSAGAPHRYLLINAAALAVGLICSASAAPLAETPASRRRIVTNATILILDVLLLAPLVLTEPVHGAHRWLFVGGLSLQPSLLLLPAAMVLFARNADAWGALGMTVAAIALALQPDRAMAGTLAAGMIALAFVRRDRVIVSASIASVIGFAITLLKPDSVPPAPYVEQVIRSSFEVSPLVGLMVIAGLAIMLAPALVAGDRDVSLVFGATWLAMILAAAFGNYPTPLVAFGSSAIVGYFLSISAGAAPRTAPRRTRS